MTSFLVNHRKDSKHSRLAVTAILAFLLIFGLFSYVCIGISRVRHIVLHGYVESKTAIPFKYSIRNCGVRRVDDVQRLVAGGNDTGACGCGVDREPDADCSTNQLSNSFRQISQSFMCFRMQPEQKVPQGVAK